MRPSPWFIGYRLLRIGVGPLLPLFEDLKPSLLKSGLKVSLDVYVSSIIFFSVIAFASSFTVAVVIGLTYQLTLWFNLLLGVGLGLLGGAVIFAMLYMYPSVRASSIGRRMDEEMPFVVGHMSVLATAGVTPEGIFRSIAAVAAEDATSDFARLIVRDIDLLGKDLISALELARQRSPSKMLSEFLDELLAIVRTGGDLRNYLTSYSRSLLGMREIAAREFGETLSSMAEFYVILMVVFPLLLVVMFSVMSLVSGTIAGFDIGVLTSFVTYLLIPLIGIAFLIGLDAIMPRGE